MGNGWLFCTLQHLGGFFSLALFKILAKFGSHFAIGISDDKRQLGDVGIVGVVRLGFSEEHSVPCGRAFLPVSLHVFQPSTTGCIVITGLELGQEEEVGISKSICLPRNLKVFCSKF